MLSSKVVLLGPQRLEPTVKEAVDSLGVDGPVATVTAGWEEREGEDTELADHLGRPSVNLELFPRAEEVFERDPELFAAMRSRHDVLRTRQEYYRMRLDATLGVARELLARLVAAAEDELLASEVEDAIESVRALDAHHLAGVGEVQAEFAERWRPAERDAVARHRRELEAVLADAEVLCIAGGHVAILLNRLRLFGVLGEWGEKPIVAWSAGAMVLSERIVLFHDNPPQGAGNAEIFGPGLGVVRGVVPLPHATRRLRLDDPVRVALLARRFGPAACAALDGRARIDWDGGAWSLSAETARLATSGTVVREPA